MTGRRADGAALGAAGPSWARALPRDERLLAATAALALVLALGLRPLAALVRRDVAAFLACPLDADDLPRGDTLDRAPGAFVRDVLHEDLRDPWGQPWRAERDELHADRMFAFQLLSAGPDGVDQGGAGDDVRLLRRPGYELVRDSPWLALAAGLVALWLWAALRAHRAPRAASLAVEAWRALVLASPLIAAAGALAAAKGREVARLEVFEGHRPLTSPVVAVTGTAALVLVLAALRLRQRRPPAADPDATLAWRGPALVVAAALAVAALAGLALWRERADLARRRLLALACLGRADAVAEVLQGPDLALLRSFARRAPPAVRLTGSPGLFDGLARAGPDAVPLLLRSLEDAPWGRPWGGPELPWRHLRRLDPGLDAVLGAIAARPARYRGTLRERTLPEAPARLVAARLGRRFVLEALGPAATGLLARDLEPELGPPAPAPAPVAWVVLHLRGLATPIPGLAALTLCEDLGPGRGRSERHVDAWDPEALHVLGPYAPGSPVTVVVVDEHARTRVTIPVAARAGETLWVEADLAAGTSSTRAYAVPP